MSLDPTIPIIWVLGGPGCGKGTQCDKLVSKYGFNHLSTGDLLRAEVQSGSDKGKELAEVMKKGELVSNEAVLGLLQTAMVQIVNTKTTTGFLIDGYPREKDQGEAFEKYIAPTDLILYFECSDVTLVSRVMYRASQSTEKRADDNEETIKTRIATFRRNTDAILVQYPKKTKRINGERPVEEIYAEVTGYIDEVIAAKSQIAKLAASN